MAASWMLHVNMLTSNLHESFLRWMYKRFNEYIKNKHISALDSYVSIYAGIRTDTYVKGAVLRDKAYDKTCLLPTSCSDNRQSNLKISHV